MDLVISFLQINLKKDLDTDQFIQDYSRVIGPLINLLKDSKVDKKLEPFIFIKIVRETFIIFKKIFIKTSLLIYFNS